MTSFVKDLYEEIKVLLDITEEELENDRICLEHDMIWDYIDVAKPDDIETNILKVDEWSVYEEHIYKHHSGKYFAVYDCYDPRGGGGADDFIFSFEEHVKEVVPKEETIIKYVVVQ